MKKQQGGQGYRTDRDRIKWGNTRKVSHGRISVPSGREGKTFETFETKNAFVNIASSSLVTGAEYIQSIKSAIAILQKKV